MSAYELLLILSAPVMVVGLAISYLGLAVFRLYIALFGLVIGGLLGFLFAFGEAAASASVNPFVFIGMPIALGVGGFLLANLLRRILVFLVGFVGGGAVGALLAIGANSGGIETFILMFGAIGVLVAFVLDTWLIIISTSATGAAMFSIPIYFVLFNSSVFIFATLFIFFTGILFQHRLFVVGNGLRNLSAEPGIDGSAKKDDPYSLSKLE